MRIICQQTILMIYHALFVIFLKSGKIFNCRLLQIIGGALRVKYPQHMFWLRNKKICSHEFYPIQFFTSEATVISERGNHVPCTKLPSDYGMGYSAEQISGTMAVPHHTNGPITLYNLLEGLQVSGLKLLAPLTLFQPFTTNVICFHICIHTLISYNANNMDQYQVP